MLAGAVAISLLIVRLGLWVLPGAAVALVVVVAFWRIDWALYALVLLLPLTAIEGMASGYNQTVQSFKRWLVLGVGVVWVVRLLLARRAPYLPVRVLLPMSLFALAALSSILRAPEPGVALTSTARLLSYCLVYVAMTMDVARSPYEVWRLVRVVLVSASVTAAFGLYQLLAYFSGWPTFLNPSYEVVYRIPRVHSFMTEPLHFANYLLFVCPLALALYAWRERTWPLLSGFAAAFSAVGILIAASRAGWAVFALSATLFGALGARAARLKHLAVMAALAALVTLGSVATVWRSSFGSFTELIDYVTSFATFSEAETGQGDLRGRLLNLGLIRQAVTTSPVIGIGTNNVGFRYHEHMTIGEPKISSSGNTYLDTFIETGGLGLLGFVALLVTALTASWRGFRAHMTDSEGALFLGVFLGTLGLAVHINFYGSLTWAAHGFFALGLSFAAERAFRASDAEAAPGVGLDYRAQGDPWRRGL